MFALGLVSSSKQQEQALCGSIHIVAPPAGRVDGFPLLLAPVHNHPACRSYVSIAPSRVLYLSCTEYCTSRNQERKRHAAVPIPLALELHYAATIPSSPPPPSRLGCRGKRGQKRRAWALLETGAGASTGPNETSQQHHQATPTSIRRRCFPLFWPLPVHLSSLFALRWLVFGESRGRFESVADTTSSRSLPDAALGPVYKIHALPSACPPPSPPQLQQLSRRHLPPPSRQTGPDSPGRTANLLFHPVRHLVLLTPDHPGQPTVIDSAFALLPTLLTLTLVNYPALGARVLVACCLRCLLVFWWHVAVSNSCAACLPTFIQQIHFAAGRFRYRTHTCARPQDGLWTGLDWTASLVASLPLQLAREGHDTDTDGLFRPHQHSFQWGLRPTSTISTGSPSQTRPLRRSPPTPPSRVPRGISTNDRGSRLLLYLRLCPTMSRPPRQAICLLGRVQTNRSLAEMVLPPPVTMLPVARVFHGNNFRP